MSFNVLRTRDAVTKKPIPKVTVELKGSLVQLFPETDAKGEMPIITCPFASYHVKLTKERYASMEFDVIPSAPFHYIDVYMSG